MDGTHDNLVKLLLWKFTDRILRFCRQKNDHMIV